jgi:transposase
VLVVMVTVSDARDGAGFWRGEAERLAAENTVLRARVAELEGQVAALSEKVATLTRLVFGASSEKKEKGKPAEPEPDDADGGGGSGRRRRGQQPGSRGHGRRDYSDLETVEEIHDVPEGDRFCPHCGAAYVPFGEECCEQIDWQVRIVRIVHRRPTYRRTCRCPVRGVLAAPPPRKAIGKGRFTTGFLARLLMEKFVLGRPVHRIVAALAADGLDVAEGTLAGVFAALSDLLGPLAAAIQARNAAAAHLHVDETSWSVFEAVQGKDGHRWWCWVFVGPDTTVFRIAKSRSLQVLAEQLGVDVAAGELPEGRALLLSSDFYAVYQALGSLDGVDNLWCWAHIRRYFIRAGDAHPKLRGWTAAWLDRIGALYGAHTAMAAAEPGSSAHSYAAAQFSAALIGIDAERKAQASRPGLHPAAAKVLATLDREWQGLARHREFPQLPLDNNGAERALRGPVVGRKNYYGSGSVVSADLAGRAWTITATAERAGINPLRYLTAYLDACAQAGGKAPQGEALTRFLPWAADQADLAAWRRAGGPDAETAAAGDSAGPAP